MCAIVDASVANQLWECGGTPAGKAFREAVDQGKVPLVTGGSQRDELMRSGEQMRRWLAELQSAGRLTRVDDEQVNLRCREICDASATDGKLYDSDDPHVIALAQVSGARLLYTKDQKLTRDFKKKRLIDEPRGRVYSTSQADDLTRSHRDLLRRNDLCRR